MLETNAGPPRGILTGRSDDERFLHVRRTPSLELAGSIAHFWGVRWDLRGHPPHVAETLPHPSVHVVFQEGRGEVGGVPRHKFSRRLEGRGRVFAMKFRPGAFYPLLGAPMSRITDRVLDMGVVFGREGRALADSIAAESDEGRCITLAEAFLRPRVAALEPEIARIRDLVERMASEREITRVEHAAALAGATVRQLERLFSRYVGATPKWVIKRYRLHEAAERLRGGAAADLAGLAADLGYFDQAHFTRDFKAMVGESPGEYAKDLA